ncbi:MAG: hypothetical protein J6T54_05005, partial [Fibrobacter sp.]|nr:hypothetical protein [Fibrobacter sp.]
PVESATRITYHTGNDRWPDIWLGKVPVKESVSAKAVESVSKAAATAIAGGVSDAKMDELIQAIDRLTEAVKSLAK